MDEQSRPTHHNEHSYTDPSSTHHQPSRDVRTPTTDVDSPEPNPTVPDSESPEPSLRFPRPVGNTHLANWISTSDPDIMRITSESVNEESGLAESTYELLTHDDTASENESYDNNDESFSESVSSLDQKRFDDVHSVSEDDEEDIPTLVTASMHFLPYMPHEEATPPASEDEEDESDTNSRSSLEYTHQQLGTPSMGASEETPKASAVWKHYNEAKHSRKNLEDLDFEFEPSPYEHVRNAVVGLYTRVKEDGITFKAAAKRRLADGPALGFVSFWMSTATLVWQVFIALSALAMPILLCSSLIKGYFPAYLGGSTVTTLTTPSPQILATTTASTIPRALTTASDTTSDITIHEESSALDWIFNRDFDLSYSTVDNSFVVDFPTWIKHEWSAKDCVLVNATREGKEIDSKLEKTPMGVTAMLPRRERYGDVDFIVESICRPTIKQTVTVNFGPYENEAAALVRQTKDLVLRVVEEKRDSWAHVYDLIHIPACRDLAPVFNKQADMALEVVTGRMGLAKQAAQKSIMGSMTKALDTTSRVSSELSTQVRVRLADYEELLKGWDEKMVRNAQTSVQLGLLNSQISAKLLWLKMTGREAEREQYQQKASVYVATKKETAKQRAREWSCWYNCWKKSFGLVKDQSQRDKLWNSFFSKPKLNNRQQLDDCRI